MSHLSLSGIAAGCPLHTLTVCTVYLGAVQIYCIYTINVSNALCTYLCAGPYGCSNALFCTHFDKLY